MGWYRESGEKRNVISGRIGKNYAPPLYKTGGVWYIGSRDHDREEPLRCYPLELQVTGENSYAFTAVLEAEMPLQDIYVCHREGLGDFVLVNSPDFAEVVVTTEDGEETSEQAPHGLPAAFMLLDGYYDYRFVDKNGNDMAG